MSELSPEGGSEGYGASSDETAAPAWSSWRVKNCPAWLVCWTLKRSGGTFSPFKFHRFSVQKFAQR